MEEAEKQSITVSVKVYASIEKVWMCWNNPEHIVNWYFASDDWHAPYAVNDVRVDGKFQITMAAKDGSNSFHFWGVYTRVEENKCLAYTIGDGRWVQITFEELDDAVLVTETFEPEKMNSTELQQAGWQAILDNFKKYVEAVDL